jgi:glutamate synthase (NADPH/NADH) small chain
MVGVYAGGDIVTGAATVILAMGAGRTAAASIKEHLKIRDTSVVYGTHSSERGIFGFDAGEQNHVRLRLPPLEPEPVSSGAVHLEGGRDP